jgi:hypothetical protein
MKFLYKIILPVIVSVSVSLVLAINSNETANISTDNSVTSQQSYRADLNKLKKEIDREIGKPRAKRVNQCRVIAFGQKLAADQKLIWFILVCKLMKTN